MAFETDRMNTAGWGEVPPPWNALTERIIAAAMEAHTQLGPGLLERIYELALEHELRQGGLRVERQVPITIKYKGAELGKQVMDTVVEGLVVVELKAIVAITEIEKAQLLSQIRCADYPIGLLINFHVLRLRDGGIHRRINRSSSRWPTSQVTDHVLPSAPSA